mmetsp:Transcript_19943/g.47950  ORF Transcript_19943/g.47950 Transcript_19943/m.47950 type:complete len:83 (+) Transcript_19943:95-343(+)
MLTFSVVSTYDVNNDSTCCLERGKTQRNDDSIQCPATKGGDDNDEMVVLENNLDCDSGEATSAAASASFDAAGFFVFSCSVI